MTTGSAQSKAEALAERLRKDGKRKVEVTSRATPYGTFWDVSARGISYFDRSLIAISWFQRKPGRQGIQVKFYGGLADGYGKQAGKLITISTIAQLEMWMTVCVGDKYREQPKTAD